MWEKMQLGFLEALERAALAAARIVPGLLVLVAVLILFVVAAIVVRVGLARLLRRASLERHAIRWGFAEVQESLPLCGLARVIARAASWAVVVAGVLVGLQVFESTSPLALRLLAYIPQVLLSVLLFGVGVAAAHYFSRAALIGAVNLQLQSARLLSVAVKWLVLLFCGALALQHLGIGGALVPASFAILFAGVVLAVALAFGLGSRDVVRRSWEERIERERRAAAGEIHHM